MWLLPGALVAVPAYHAAYAVQYMSVAEAQRAAFADAGEFTPVALDRTALDAALAAVSESALGNGWSPQVFQARKDGSTLGWLIVDQVIGSDYDIGTVDRLLNMERGDQLIVESLPFESTLNLDPPASAAPVSVAQKTQPKFQKLTANPKLIAGAAAGVVAILGGTIFVLRRRKASSASQGVRAAHAKQLDQCRPPDRAHPAIGGAERPAGDVPGYESRGGYAAHL